jgi:NAD dependent epimerase/dehydratase
MTQFSGLNWKAKRVLVTGAGGFIGSHLVERLAVLGAEVRALVHYNSLGRWGWLDESPVAKDIQVVAGDITDRDALREALADREIVFHLAALIAIPYSYRAPESYVRTNVEGTLNVLQCTKLAGVERVVHTSTSEVYGTARYVPIDESHPLQGQSPYAASKIGADKMVEAFHRSFGLPVVTVRPFNTFGPRQSARAVIPTVITQCLCGQTVHLGNLRPTRDMNFVSDTVEGFLCAAGTPEAVGGTFNLGSGREIAVGELAQLIGRLANRPVDVASETARLRPEGSEVDRLLANNQQARNVLHWTPAVTLEEGLRRTIEWFGANLSRYRVGGYVV